MGLTERNVVHFATLDMPHTFSFNVCHNASLNIRLIRQTVLTGVASNWGTSASLELSDAVLRLPAAVGPLYISSIFLHSISLADTVTYMFW